MSRRYKPNAASACFVYSVEEVMKLYNVSQNTVSNWLKHGLIAGDAKTPLLFRGAELNRFQRERRMRNRTHLRPCEFKCFACKAASFPDPELMSFASTPKGAILANAACPDCAATVQKILSETECDMLRNRAVPNTTEDTRDEIYGPVYGDIGNAAPNVLENHSQNDRVLHQWQGWAGRFAKQTQAAHLAAIRDFENHLNGKVFAQITTDDAASYRDALMERSRMSKEEGGLSRSTLAHRASHVASFFQWLAKQPGHRHLAKLDGWLDLPKGFRAKADEKPAKPYPTLEQAERALAAMRSSTLKGRRDRAIFAATFVTGLREDALITLRRKHIDPLARTARQDGTVMRAKNGKSYVARWFPRTEAFQEEFCEWIHEVDALGLRGLCCTNGLRGGHPLSPNGFILRPL
ncbi:helix-turn-helix domain-containing protein [Sagittula sp. NFXS13]|uniref:helix-turn-helix domain-containing protein n=1 Tax=Sagittula sp. NFXS13 TaxID=2819095 RepID=UPI0032DF138C